MSVKGTVKAFSQSLAKFHRIKKGSLKIKHIV